jgi:hypothetical protein|uniref:Uncharacterized protein n=1 Tax=Phaeodactylum tricornutum TaxID=2850 RepID=A0A8J9SFB8_PHATR
MAKRTDFVMMVFPLLLTFALTKAAAFSTSEISGNSEALRLLISAERQLDQNSGVSDFIGQYSVKFQGCHHVQQWNNDADGEEDVRIKTKRLARFRLCPVDQCSSDRSAGCTSRYGDYVVDLDTFLQNFVSLQNGDACDQADEDCANNCSSDDSGCLQKCYQSYGAGYCLEEDKAEAYGFDVSQYLDCTQIDGGNDKAYYVGPYCANQGGDVRLGVFSDDTCTTFAQSGGSAFSNTFGFNLPYSSESLVTSQCVGCGSSDGNGNVETNQMCGNVYSMSGKCETRMAVDYPNESSCGYIEGIKVIREDGVIRSSTVRKSKAAAVSIGLFTTVSVLLAGYAFYLRTKLGRAQINLAAASQPLT